MNNAVWAMLNESEKALLRDAEPAALARLDEDGLLALHDRVRRARNKYAKLYRRRAAGQVGTDAARRAGPRHPCPDRHEGRGLRGRPRPRVAPPRQGGEGQRGRAQGRAPRRRPPWQGDAEATPVPSQGHDLREGCGAGGQGEATHAGQQAGQRDGPRLHPTGRGRPRPALSTGTQGAYCSTIRSTSPSRTRSHTAQSPVTSVGEQSTISRPAPSATQDAVAPSVTVRARRRGLSLTT